MHRKCIICVAESPARAETIVALLNRDGFGFGEIAIEPPHLELGRPQDGDSQAAAGGSIRSALDWLSGVGALAIPGLGAFLAARPVVSASRGASTASQSEPRNGVDSRQGGRIRILVHTPSLDAVRRAWAAVHKAGASGVELAERSFAARSDTSAVSGIPAGAGALASFA
jgi:hypothetical protein